MAGPHRLTANLALLGEADAVVVVAGMEGALPSVVGGHVACPVIAVPTSVGYGASFGGIAALLGMLEQLRLERHGGEYRRRFQRRLRGGTDRPERGTSGRAGQSSPRGKTRLVNDKFAVASMSSHQENLLPRLPPRRPDAHKGDFGSALIVGGSRGMAGAAALAGLAALRGGAGLVRLAVPETRARYGRRFRAVLYDDSSAG